MATRDIMLKKKRALKSRLRQENLGDGNQGVMFAEDYDEEEEDDDDEYGLEDYGGQNLGVGPGGVYQSGGPLEGGQPIQQVPQQDNDAVNLVDQIQNFN